MCEHHTLLILKRILECTESREDVKSLCSINKIYREWCTSDDASVIFKNLLRKESYGRFDFSIECKIKDICTEYIELTLVKNWLQVYLILSKNSIFTRTIDYCIYEKSVYGILNDGSVLSINDKGDRNISTSFNRIININCSEGFTAITDHRVKQLVFKQKSGFEYILLKDGTTIENGPIEMRKPPDGNLITQLSVGVTLAIGVTNDGQLVRWGVDFRPEHQPVYEVPSTGKYVQVEMAYLRGDICAALLSNGSVELFTNSRKIRLFEHSVIQISFNTLLFALLFDGSVVALDIFGDCSIVFFHPPVGLKYVKIVSNYDRAIALLSDGTLAVWCISDIRAQPKIIKPPVGKKFV